MKIEILFGLLSAFFSITNSFCLQSFRGNDDDLCSTLLSERIHIDTLFSEDELALIEEIKRSFEDKITSANIDLVMKFCYPELTPVLNEHKKSLQNISKQLFDRCLLKYTKYEEKKGLKKLKFITSPLPFILLVDDRFVHLIKPYFS
ncbi:MAG: hypothetical protein AAF519_04565 [Bacteroidota bacterium]